MNESRARTHASVLTGLTIIGVGVILLLDQQGILPIGHLFRFWPMIFVAVGLLRLYVGPGSRERMFGGILILLGVLLQLSELHYRRFELRHLWPVAIIGAGLWILYWSMGEGRQGAAWSNSEIKQLNVFGGGEYKITARDFRGGKLMAFFGGFKLDLTQADLANNQAVIDIEAMFGGGEIVVPQSWEVAVRGVAFFGGYNDETQRPLEPPGGPKKLLILTGVAIFGGVNIRNAA